MIQISVNNMLSIKNAELELTPGKITGVTGRNMVGKSSLSVLAAALLAGEPNPAGSKAKSKAYLQDNTDSGSASIKVDGYPVANWNAVSGDMGKFESDFNPVPIEAVGLIDFCSQMSQAQKTALWEQFFLPPDEELRAEFERQLKPHISEEVLDELFKKADEFDYEVVFKTYEKRGRDAKRNWMAIAGENWGKAKAVDWIPKDWTSSLDGMTVSAIEEKISYQREELAALHVDHAISRADVEKGKKAIAEMGQKNEQLAALRQEAIEAKGVLTSKKEIADEVLARLYGVRAKIERHASTRGVQVNVLNCPVCSAHLAMDGDTLCIHDVEDSKAKEEKWVKEHEELKRQAEPIELELAEAQKKKVVAQEVFDEIGARGRELAAQVKVLEGYAKLANETPTDENAKAIELANEAIQRSVEDMRLVKSRADARQIHENIVDYSTICSVVGPKGVRATCMEENMAAFDSLLELIATLTGWPRVTLDRTYAVSIGKRSFLRLCAGTERLGAQYALQLAIAKFTNAKCVIFDEADTLDKPNRDKLWDLMHAVCGRKDAPAFMVCGTDLDLEHLNRDGNNYRVVDGELKALEYA